MDISKTTAGFLAATCVLVGAGGAYVSSYVLQRAKILDAAERVALAFTAGGGAEDQLQNRHFAFGVGGAWWLMPEFDAMQGIDARLYLRYTY